MSARRINDAGRIDHTRALSFTWDGKQLWGYQGDSLASALLALAFWLPASTAYTVKTPLPFDSARLVVQREGLRTQRLVAGGELLDQRRDGGLVGLRVFQALGCAPEGRDRLQHLGDGRDRPEVLLLVLVHDGVSVHDEQPAHDEPLADEVGVFFDVV